MMTLSDAGAVAQILTAVTATFAVVRLFYERHTLMAEADVKAATLLGNLIERAESRGEAVYSELLVEKALDAGFLSITREDSDKRFSPFFTAPIGLSSQRAAVYSIAVIGRRYDHLRATAERALVSISDTMPSMTADANRALLILRDDIVL